MLVIGDKQFAALEVEQMRRFVDRVIAFLREHFEDMRDMSDDTLRMAIEPLIEKAKGYGLTTERQVVWYILAAKEFGADFDTRMAEAATALNNKTLEAEEKRDALQNLINAAAD